MPQESRSGAGEMEEWGRSTLGGGVRRLGSDGSHSDSGSNGRVGTFTRERCRPAGSGNRLFHKPPHRYLTPDPGKIKHCAIQPGGGDSGGQ